MISKHLLELALTCPHNILAIYPYGSRVYNSHTSKSDYDYIVIISNENLMHVKDINAENTDLKIYTYVEFQEKLNNHDMDALEVYNTEPIFTTDIVPFDFTLDLSKLRKTISAKSSNSWVKAKKKITLEEEDTYIGIKSLFHSQRIVMFGIQIAKHGKIIDFEEATFIYDDLIMLDDSSWEFIQKRYKSRYNKLMTEFRKLAPKELKNER